MCGCWWPQGPGLCFAGRFHVLLPQGPSPSSYGSLVVLSAPDLGPPPAACSPHDSLSSSRGTPGLALHDPLMGSSRSSLDPGRWAGLQSCPFQRWGLRLPKARDKWTHPSPVISGNTFSKTREGTFLVVQWLRVCHSMWGTWVQSLVEEDSTRHGATRPGCCTYGAHQAVIRRAVF